MANQTITANTNHDALTGRAAGEDITIQLGAKLTIDSMPHLTTMGILGDILLTSGEVHIDGTRTFEAAYSNGSGSLPAVGTAISWNAGADTGKIVRLNSGTNASGVLTLTKDVGETTPDSADSITDGSWTADLDSVKIGLLIVFGEDQVWDATDATCTLRVTGDWYEIGTGTGADNQSITLPHTGVQHAVWVETGSGTGVYEIWHRVNVVASAVFFDEVADWGSLWKTGKVFSQVPGSSTLDFGTSTNGGAPANGAKIRIPNVHMGTTTVGAPTTEYVSTVVGSTLELVDSAVTENVYIDHLNASSVQVSLVQCGAVDISDSCFGWWNATNIINRNNTQIIFDNCAWVCGTGLTGEIAVAMWVIQDNIGGLIFNDCIFYAGTNANSGTCVSLLTMANVSFYRCKFVNNQQDENTMASFRGSVALNVYLEDCTLLNGGIITAAGCINWEIIDFTWSELTARGTTEDSMTVLSFVGTDTIYINGGTFNSDGTATNQPNGAFASFTDCSNIKLFNIGGVDAKIDCGARGTNIIVIAGITSDAEFKRIFFTNRNTALPFSTINSSKNILFENCSGDYNDELEMHCNSTIMKGIHGASGNIGTATGWEDDYPNVYDAIFYDCFKSDTTGGVGLLFNPKGALYSAYVTADTGVPVWNAIGDLLMTTLNDQATYTFPYWIKGHTAFTSILPHLLGVNCGTLGSGWGNFNVQYDLDTGSGYSGTFKDATTTNLTGETIAATGFKIKIRIICTTASATNAIRGLQIHTSTTIAAQKANYYPLAVVPVSVTILDITTGLPIENARVYIINDTTKAVLCNQLTNTSGNVSFDIEAEANINITGWVRKATVGTLYQEGSILGVINSETGYSTTIQLVKDE